MSNPKHRRELIQELLRTRRVATQQELIALLAERGLATTQPMLSRDLRALGVAKREGAYRLVDAERVTPLSKLRLLLRGARAVPPNLVVVSCEPGAASAIARALEAEDLAEVLGTVAGDDTVFVAVASKAAGQRVLRPLRDLLR